MGMTKPTSSSLKDSSPQLLITPSALMQMVAMIFATFLICVWSVYSLILGFGVGTTSKIVVGYVLLISLGIITRYHYLFSISTLRIPGIFAASYITIIILPIPFIYIEHTGNIRDVFVMATSISFLSTLLGVIVVHHIVTIPRYVVYKWFTQPLRIQSGLSQVSIVLLIICYGIFALYIQKTGIPPLIDAIQGGKTTLELAQARENALKLIEGRIVYIFILLRSVLFPYVTLLLLPSVCQGGRMAGKILFIIALVGNLMMQGATLEKSPVAAFVIILAFAWLITTRSLLSLKQWVLIIVFAMIFPIFVVLATYQFDAEFSTVLISLFERIFYVPDNVLYYYFEFFPAEQGFLLGRTLPSIGKLLPNGSFPAANILCLYIIPDNQITSCSANAAYPATLWADFGWYGIILGSFLVGIIIQLIQTFIHLFPKSPPTIALQAIVALNVIYLTSASMPDLIFANGIGYDLVMTIGILFVLNIFKTKKQT